MACVPTGRAPCSHCIVLRVLPSWRLGLHGAWSLLSLLLSSPLCCLSLHPSSLDSSQPLGALHCSQCRDIHLWLRAVAPVGSCAANLRLVSGAPCNERKDKHGSVPTSMRFGSPVPIGAQLIAGCWVAPEASEA